MGQKRMIITLAVFVIVLASLVLFYTYAVDVKMDRVAGDADLTYNINITDTSGRTVTVPKRDSKVFDFFLTNNNGGTIRYGLAYSGTKPATVKIAQMSNSKNPVNGTIPDNTTYQVTITIINDSDTEQSFTIAPVTGYQNGGDLIVPSGYTLIKDTHLALPQPANDYIISLSKGDSWESGARGVYQTNGHEYRYVGANVNNYVSFNNDLYRIIGVFDSNSTGVNANLVKLISANSLGGYSWGVTNSSPDYTTYLEYNNNWETANANILLNEYWLNATDTSTTYKSCSDWTYYNTNNDYKTKDCSNIVGYGIQTANLRNYIQPVTWYLKGYDSTSYSKQNFYTCERSDETTITNCSSGNQGGNDTKVEDKSIGLMYVSDYLYASGYYASTNTANASEYYYGQQNWLYNGYEWTMTPVDSGSASAFNVSYSGSASNNLASNPYALRPSFYLKSTIKIKSGTGTIKNPFVIG